MHEQPLDPDVLTLMAELGTEPPPPASQQTAAQLRQTMDDAIAVFTRGVEPPAVHEIADEHVSGRHGPIPVRLYRPEHPVAVIAYMHGGAWTVGGIESHDYVTRRICRDTDAIVVSVDYRMLPEHPFPVPFDDSYDAVVWASTLRPDLPFLVGGDSAGGTHAACVSLRARDEDGPRIDGQVLVYPGIDDDLDRPSIDAYRDGPGVNHADLIFYLEQYAGADPAARTAYALPGLATSLADLPPAIVAIAGHDILRSSEEDYAARLAAAGVPTTVQLDHEQMHSWIDYAPRVPSASRAFTRLTDSINELISNAVAAART